ncbi:acyl carrier protein [Sphingomonas endophytica]|uniref:Acyl carrier protein n=1 Tax=Sphingomonas endophytica TaxID=869719 RepID=A0A147I104_9SPHN|nr:acyl carrier protein [Sphingomonas endophytica]KTT71170.1 acyl carrier protein [Sphingomonas endophytica]
MSEFYEGMAEILDVDVSEVGPDLELGEAWDSLAIVSTIALIDEIHDRSVSPDALAQCRTVGQVEALAAAAE